MMFDIAAGIVIGAFLVFGVVYGARQAENGTLRDRGMVIAAVLLAGALICWRASCWYWGVACDVPQSIKTQAASACPAPGAAGYVECMAPQYGIDPSSPTAQ